MKCESLMTNRQIDWTPRPLTEQEKKAANQQQYAVTTLIFITMSNIFFGILMVYGFLPVSLGMVAAFVVMGLFIIRAQKALLGDGERMWETPEKFHDRMSK